jgi:hypothetical protein
VPILLNIARAVWILVTLLTLGLYIDGLPLRYEQLISGVDSRALLELNLSTQGYGTFLITLEILVVLVHALIAAIIFRRRAEDWMALLLAFALVTNGALFSLTLTFSETETNLILQLLLELVTAIGLIVGMIMLYLFPTGRFVPHWTGWLALSWAILMVTAIFFPDQAFSFSRWPTFLQLAVLILWTGTGVFAQIFRYVNVSKPIQRQQAKWAMFGLTAAAIGPFFYFLPFVILPAIDGPAIPNLLFQRVGASFFAYFLIFRLAGTTLFRLAFLIFPLSFAIAILRYRLWDIDVIINRALVYGVLTGLLALIFFGFVTLLENFFRTFTGQGSQFAVVLSTLTIVWLFNPLRARVQNQIDRRFYRQKYDAARTLSNFAEMLRDEVDLDAIETALLSAVEDTMRPDHVSLWLRSSLLSEPSQKPRSVGDLTTPPQKAPQGGSYEQ